MPFCVRIYDKVDCALDRAWQQLTILHTTVDFDMNPFQPFTWLPSYRRPLIINHA